MIEDEGIVVTTAAAVDMERILVSIDVEKFQRIADFKYLIAPLLCRNKEDQDKIYRVFDEIDEKFEKKYTNVLQQEKNVDKDLTIKVEPSLTWYKKKLVIPISVVLLLALVIYILFPIKQDSCKDEITPHKIHIIATPEQLLLKDTVHFTAEIDSSINLQNITVDWRFPDSFINNRLVVDKTFSDTALTKATAILKYKNGVAIDSNEYSIKALCEPPPQVAINETDIAKSNFKKAESNKKQFEPLFTNPSNDSAKYTYKWFIDDYLYAQDKKITYSKPFNTIKLVVYCKGVHCSTDSLLAQIETIPALNVAVTSDNNLRIQSTYNWTNILIVILLLLILPGFISFFSYRFIRSFKAFTPVIEELEPGTEGPYEIQFADQQQKIHEDGINKFADVLRKRQVSDVYKLNIRKTIRSTVVAGGIPTLVFTPLSKPLGFLAFIDKEHASSHLVKLFEYLVDKLYKKEVDIITYTYEKEPLFLSNEKLNQENIPLEKVAALYPDTVLFIFGNAQYFSYTQKGIIKNWATKLNHWPIKILVTPYAAVDWDKKEKLLIDANFVVLPADLSSVIMIDEIISRQIDTTAQKKEGLKNGYGSRFINFQDFNALEQYLGKGHLMQWVCSLAVYPTIDWNFTIAMGKAIEEQLIGNNIKNTLVNYSNILKMARISWMQDGIINESLRVQMFAFLNKEAEALARKTLNSQLQLIEKDINKNSLVKTSFNIHTKLNNFLLDAHYHNKTSKADDAFIKKIIENNQIDEGQDIYLSKGDNTLLRDPLNKRNSIGLRDYFTSKLSRQKMFSAVCAFVILAALILLTFFIVQKSNVDFNFKQTNFSTQNYTVNFQGASTNKKATFSLYYEPTHTQWRSQQIDLNDTSFNFKYDSVLIKDTSDYGLIKISTNSGKLITQDSFKLNSLTYTINLSEITKTPLIVFYSKASDLSVANALAEKFPSNFNVQIKQFNSSYNYKTGVSYFSKNHEKDAINAINTLSSFLDKKIQGPQFLDSSSTLKAETKDIDIVVFINDSVPCTPLAVSALPQLLNEIWHGGTSNRLININLSKNAIYYSVDDVKTYGSYNINEVCLSNKGVYKIITKSNQGYKLFFIKNVTAQSFYLSVCQNFTLSKQELENKDESYCDHFNLMSLYYETGPDNADKIYLPILGHTLDASQKKKLSILADSIKTVRKLTSKFKYNAGIYSSSLFNNFDLNDFQNNLKDLNIDFATNGNYVSEKGNPFKRNYVVLHTIVELSHNILWLDDHPENNKKIIAFFNEKNIQVDIAYTNEQAYQKLNSNIYCYIITDIGRNNLEPCVADKNKAGIDFIQKVNYPKEYIIVFSTDTTIARNESVLQKAIPTKNFNLNTNELQNFIVENIDYGNVKGYAQQLCKQSKQAAKKK